MPYFDSHKKQRFRARLAEKDGIKTRAQPTGFFRIAVLSLLCGFVFLPGIAKATTETFTTTGANTWQAPAGVTSVIVDTWAGGGGGGQGPSGPDNSSGGSGGAGGAYAKSTLTVVPATVYNYSVGAGGSGGASGKTGGDSWFNTTGTIIAKGGGGGTAGQIPDGFDVAGGTANTTQNIGETVYYGGNGGIGSGFGGTYDISGGGGGGAGSGGAGGNASYGTGGTAGATDGGAGPNGRSSTGIGTVGNVIGSGGAGGYTDASGKAGGAGARGQIVLTYTAIVAPTLSTDLPTSVATSTLTLNGSITATGGADATESGFAYGTVSDLSTTIATSTLGAQTGTASFLENLSGLTPNTLYYLRAYAVNSAGTSTGAIISTTTLAVSAPTVTTQAASSVTATTATGNGTITVTGNINPTVRGVVYGATTAYGATTTPETGDFSTGAFTSSITPLTCNTLYHIAAYATNSQGTGYGSDATFTTTACVPTLTTSAASSVAQTSATLNGAISDTGGENATTRGFQYGTDTSYGSTAGESGSHAAGSFSTTISSLTCNTTYHARSFATNSVGTSYGSDTSFTTSGCPGNGAPGSIGVGRGGTFVSTSPSPVNQPPPTMTVTGGLAGIIESIIPDFFKGKPEETPPPQPAQEKSLSLESSWDLINPFVVRNFTLAPLPFQLTDLTVKYPELDKVFTKLGVTKISDLSKLQGVSISLPEIDNLKNLPREVVAVKGGAGNVGVISSIILDDTGKVEQKIQTTANTTLTLAVRPSAPVDAVTGYLVFREGAKKTVVELPIGLQAASAILALQSSSSAAPNIPDRELLVQTFSYDDSDGDGVYTANIKTPAVEGTYEVITLITYRDKTLGTKELRLLTVVDPEGYVYEIIQGKEARVPNVSVSIFNADTNALWDSVSYNQVNPQMTDTSGKYSFLVPEGKYYITAEGKGYLPYKSDTFTVQQGLGIHFNIELRSSGWLSGLDWKTMILILIILVISSAFAGYVIHEHALKRKLMKGA